MQKSLRHPVKTYEKKLRKSEKIITSPSQNIEITGNHKKYAQILPIHRKTIQYLLKLITKPRKKIRNHAKNITNSSQNNAIPSQTHYKT